MTDNVRQAHIPSSSIAFSPEQVRPFAKAAPRKQSLRGRKQGSSKILTDTPVKQQIKAEEVARASRKGKAAKSKPRGVQKKAAKQVLQFDEDSDGSLSLHDDS